MRTGLKKVLGVLLIILGTLALITPLTPGSWLVFVGAGLLGIDLVFAHRFAAFLTRQKAWFVPLSCFAAPFIAALIGGAFTVEAVSTWYATLLKPAWTPPDYLFGPVWTLLYFLMGLAALYVWRSGKPGRDFALTVFFAHLVINALWSVVFFGAHAPDVALGVIVLLWLLIVWLVVLFGQLSKVAGWLLVPYVLWVTYASTLNLGIVLLN